MSKRFRSKRNHRGTRIPVLFNDTTPIEVPITFPHESNYSHQDFQSRVGQWVDFKTSWGRHRGVVEEVRNKAVLIKVPNEYASTGLVSYLQSMKDDIQLAGCDGFNGCNPCIRRGPWCWIWFPFIIVIFIFPFFCW